MYMVHFTSSQIHKELEKDGLTLLYEILPKQRASHNHSIKQYTTKRLNAIGGFYAEVLKFSIKVLQ